MTLPGALAALLTRLAVAAEPVLWDEPAPALELTEAERARLDAGEVVWRADLNKGGSAGRSMVLVRASEDQVWDVILNPDDYVLFLPYVTASWAEPRGQDAPQERLRWGMELTTKGVVTRYAVESRATPAAVGRTMRWEMIPSGASPMSRATGYWMSLPWGDGRTLLVYAVDVETAWWLPVMIHQTAADRGLPTTVALFGRRAEKLSVQVQEGR